MLTLIVLVLIIASAKLVYGKTVASSGKKQIRQASVQEKKQQLGTLYGQHDHIQTTWADYELDLEKMIKFPLFTDASHPATSQFLQTMHSADIARPSENVDLAKFDLSEYRKAVGTLHTDFKALENVALRSAWGQFSEVEKSRLKRALDLLAMARDDAASPHERQSAYKRVLREVEGLIVLPPEPLRVLEDKMRKAITVT